MSEMFSAKFSLHYGSPNTNFYIMAWNFLHEMYISCVLHFLLFCVCVSVKIKPVSTQHQIQCYGLKVWVTNMKSGNWITSLHTVH